MPITSYLVGRLGNQLFQLCTMIAYGIDNDMAIEIPLHTANDEVWPPYFSYLHIPLLERKRVGIYFIEEQSHAYSKIPSRKEDNLFLWSMKGYFQSYKYFDHHKKELAEIFGFNILPLFNNDVNVHIRRGDYLLYPDKHPVVTLEYLRQAISQFEGDEQYVFNFFSDDIQWCKENITTEFLEQFECVYATYFVESGDPLHDLRCYAAASHHIISNSTWSYFGSYFKTGTGKTITPHEDNWYGESNKHLSVEDLLPPDWIRIKY